LRRPLVPRARGSVIERVKIQAQVLVPLVKAFQVMASAFASFAKSDALDYSVRAQTEDTFEIDVTGCRYAQFYKELGEPELGFLLACSSDFLFADGLGPDIKLTRTQTIMQGASHCDFRYRRQPL